MYLRTFSFGLLLLAVGCAPEEENKVAAAPPEDRIECATGGAAEFTRTCAVERSDDGTTLTIRHGDGGFRRLSISPDLAVSTADGAAVLSGKALPDGRLEVGVDGDRYRLPPK